MRMTNAVDEDFMTRFKQGVGSRDYDPATVDLVVNIFLGILVLAVIYALWALISRYIGGRGRRHQDPEVARLLLKQALLQHSEFELVLSRPDGASRKLDAILVGMSADSLEVELTRLGELSSRLLDRSLECVFKLQDMRVASGARAFAFAAKVTNVVNHEGRGASLFLTIPLELVESGQRRGAMRVPAEENIKSATLWPEASFAWPTPHPMAVSAPPLRLEKGRQAAARLVNVSGGGARIEVRKTMQGSQVASLAKGSLHVLLLTLHDPEKKEDLEFILLARIQNSYEYRGTDRMELGLQFIKRGVPPGNPGGALAWRELEDGSVLELEAWVIKRHLATHRPFRGFDAA